MLGGKNTFVTRITADKIVKELARIGFSDIRKAFTENGDLRSPAGLDDETAAAICSIEVVTRSTGQTDADGNKVVEHVHKLRFWDKNSSLEKLGKHLAMFTKNVKVKSTIEELTDDQLDARIAELRRKAGIGGASNGHKTTRQIR